MSRDSLSQKMLVVFVALLAGLPALEGLVRLFHVAPPLVREYGNSIPDSFLPYRPRPDSVVSGRSATDEYDFEYRHNSTGQGRIFKETYLYRLEERLNLVRPYGRKVGFIKAGVSRFFPEPERIILEWYGTVCRPDIILVDFVPNDVIDTYLGMDAIVVDASGFLKRREAQQLGSAGTWFYLRSHVFRYC